MKKFSLFLFFCLLISNSLFSIGVPAPKMIDLGLVFGVVQRDSWQLDFSDHYELLGEYYWRFENWAPKLFNLMPQLAIIKMPDGRVTVSIDRLAAYHSVAHAAG